MRGIVTDDNDPQLQADGSAAEWSGSTNIDLTPTGFKITSSSAQYNEDTRPYIYMAIRRPHKPASEFAATDLFHVESAAFTDSIIGNDFPADIAFYHQSSSDNYKRFTTRLTQGNVLYLDQTSAEASENYVTFDNNEGAEINYSGSLPNFHWRVFRRAPGFIDVVTYEGNSTQGREVSHNLTTAPEMMWIKDRGVSTDYVIYAEPVGATKFLQFGQSAAISTDADERFDDTAPTESVFTLGNKDEVNASSRNYLAILFGSVDGISKVGSYTGTGNDLNVDCGFSSGARFVIIKRTDSTGDWFVWDTARGIVAGNDPYFRINEFSGDITNTDYIDPLSSGFTVTSSAPSGINASGGTYLFYAIA